MGTRWQLKGDTLTVSELTRPYENDLPARKGATITSAIASTNGTSLTLKLRSGIGGYERAAEIALAELNARSYLDNRQKITIKRLSASQIAKNFKPKLPTFAVEIIFEHQIPAQATDLQVGNILKSSVKFTNDRIIFGTFDEAELTQKVWLLWSFLWDCGVPTTLRPPKF